MNSFILCINIYQPIYEDPSSCMVMGEALCLFWLFFTLESPTRSCLAAWFCFGWYCLITYSFLHVQLAFMTHFYLAVPSKKIQNSFLFFFLHICIWIWVLVGVLIHLCILNEWVYIIKGAACCFSGCQKPFVNSFLGV